MNILFSFDTEDFATPESDDAAKYYADALSRRRIQGTFFIVAEKLRALKRRGRYDVIHALSKHDIGYHGENHSVFPTINEYQDRLSWGEGIEELLAREEIGLKEVSETFERDIISVCPPGANWSAVMLAGFKKMGIRICAGAMLDGGNGISAWFCGVLNLCYDMAEMEDPFMSLANAERVWPRYKELTGQRRNSDGHIAIFTHPTM